MSEGAMACLKQLRHAHHHAALLVLCQLPSQIAVMAVELQLAVGHYPRSQAALTSKHVLERAFLSMGVASCPRLVCCLMNGWNKSKLWLSLIFVVASSVLSSCSPTHSCIDDEDNRRTRLDTFIETGLDWTSLACHHGVRLLPLLARPHHRQLMPP